MLCQFHKINILKCLVYSKYSDFLCLSPRSISCLHSYSSSDLRSVHPLAYDHIGVDEELPAIIILHGLLGNKKNWRSLMNNIKPKISRSIFLLDARNHGESPHANEFNYNVLAEDVKQFMKDHSLKKGCMVGHSLGGRTAMTLALHNPSLIEKLVIVDISPIYVPGSSKKTLEYINCMLQVDFDTSISISEARRLVDKKLKQICPETFIRNFLLTNLSIKNGKIKWIVNLESIKKNFNSGIERFPLENTGKRFEGETHFIAGQNSDYIRTEDYDAILNFFPNANFHTIKDAGHFVHSEQPEKVKEILMPIFNC